MRRIQCRHHEFKLPRADRLNGWKMRHVFLILTRAGLLCDACGVELSEHSFVIAVSMWRGDEIRGWEEEFGQVLPLDAVKLTDKLESS